MAALNVGALAPVLAFAFHGETEKLRALLRASPELVNFASPGEQGGTTPLHAAIAGGSIGVLSFLLSVPGLGLNAVSRAGLTPLHEAVLRGSDTAVAMLLDAPGCDVNARSTRGWPPLFYAALIGSEPIVRSLEDAGADVTVVDGEGLNAAHVAAASGQLDALRTLVTHGAAFNARTTDAERNTPLLLAVAYGHTAAAAFLLAAGADPTSANAAGLTVRAVARTRATKALLAPSALTTLRSAAGRYTAALDALARGAGSPRAVNTAAAELRASLSVSTASPAGLADLARGSESGAHLTDASARVSPALVGELGVDCALDSATGEGALYRAAARGNAEAVSALLKLGANPLVRTRAGDTPLAAACRAGAAAAVSVLLEERAGPQIAALVYSRTALWAALDAPDSARATSCIERLADAGADVNVVGPRHRTVLFDAVERGLLDVVMTLLSAGADPTHLDSQRRTPLHLAAELGASLIVDRLLSAGADPNAADIDRTCPLHLAAMQGSVECVTLLLGAGAKANSATAAQWTPLHGAALAGDVATARALIAAGASVGRMNTVGQSFLQVAQAAGDDAFVAALAPLVEAAALAETEKAPLVRAPSVEPSRAALAPANGGGGGGGGGADADAGVGLGARPAAGNSAPLAVPGSGPSSPSHGASGRGSRSGATGPMDEATRAALAAARVFACTWAPRYQVSVRLGSGAPTASATAAATAIGAGAAQRARVLVIDALFSKTSQTHPIPAATAAVALSFVVAGDGAPQLVAFKLEHQHHEHDARAGVLFAERWLDLIVESKTGVQRAWASGK